MNGIRKIPLAVALALGAGQAWALGLGNIEVRSALNEPLSAEILLTAADAEEIASLRVQLASPEDFQRIGLRRSQLTVPLEFAVGRNDRGQPVIKLTSKAPVREPFLSVLIDAQWTGGRMLREYTMLLDPPLTAPAVRGTVAAAPTRVPESRPSQVEALPDERPSETRPERPRPVTEPSRPAAAATPSTEPARPSTPARAVGEYGPVAEGETLWVIASNTRPGSEVNVNQMMIAIQQANPEAFINNNINLLRRGAILRIPSADEVRSISSAEAAQLAARQNEQWRESRGERALPRVEPSDATPVAQTTPRREPAPRSDDRLALLPPGDERRRDAGETRPGVSADSVEVEGLRADLARSRESLSASEQELRELRDRVRELENLQSSQDRLLSLKDGELADLQRRLAELQADRGVTDDSSPPMVADGEPVEGELFDEDAVADAVEAPADSADPFVLLDPPAASTRPSRTPGTEDTAPAPVEAEPVREAAPTAAPVLPPRPAPTPWYTSPWVFGGVAVLMAVVLALMARRRRSSGSEAQRGSPNLASRLVAASAAGGAATASGQSADDDLAELQALVAEDPSDLSAHLALLRHRFDQGDGAGFEADAETMSGYVTDTAAPEWDEVRMMGAELAPEHPLFRDTSAAGDVQQDEPDFAEAFDFSDADGEPGAEPFSISLGDSLPDDVETTGEFEPTFEPDRTDAGRASAGDPVDNYSTQQFASIDIENALDHADVSGDGLSLDEGGDDAVATKLDLAREYLDLGDPEGARSLLEEVLKEGSSAQKAEAQRLMVQIR